MVNVDKMDKIYEDANDQHVRANVVYRNHANKNVYVDKEYTISIDADTLINLFLKGTVLICDWAYEEGRVYGYFRPDCCFIEWNDDGQKYVTLTYHTDGVAYSCEYSYKGDPS